MRRTTAQRAEAGQGTERITVDMCDDSERSWQEAFDGRWLVEPDARGTRTGEPGYDAGQYWGVALTAKGRIAVYTAHCNDGWTPKLYVADSLDDAELPADIARTAALELGEDVVVTHDW